MDEEDWKRNYRNIYVVLKNYFSSSFQDIDDIGKEIIEVRDVKRLSPKHLCLAYLIVVTRNLNSFPIPTDILDDDKIYGTHTFDDWMNILFDIGFNMKLGFFNRLRILTYVYRIVSSELEGKNYLEKYISPLIDTAEEEEEGEGEEEEEFIYEYENDTGLDDAEIVYEDEY